MKINRLFAWFVFFIVPAAFTQEKNSEEPVSFTPAQARLESYRERVALRKNSLVKNVAFRSVGPTIMSGRVVDVDVSPDDPTIFYVAYASGGLWKTSTNGISFTPLFDDQPAITIGDIAVDWKHSGTIWVGTGENNSSRSSYAGTGIYKSGDGGKNWQFMGLEETHHIGRIVIHPGDPNTVWVAALGHLYSPNPERGVFKTTDGGTTWKKVLFVDDNTGAVDVIVDPDDSNILYAAMWHRQRRAWNFTESGKTSGIYKSTDGGETWSLLTQAGSGFPTGDGIGRIGLAMIPGHSNLIYAVLDNQFRREKKTEEEFVLTKDTLRNMPRDKFSKLNKDDINDFLDRYEFPKEYTADTVSAMVRSGKIEPKNLAEYTEDANALLFDRPVIGAEVYCSHNFGKTWQRANEKYLDNLFYSYGYYFGQIRVAPYDSNKIYIVGVPVLKSEDGGKSFKALDADNTHGDHHGLWIDPNRKGHLILGNDGGLNISYDDGAHWFKANTPAVGQFYAVTVDMAKPYNVYGGLQDNGVWVGPSLYKAGYAWYDEGSYPYKRLYGGDGMQVAVDPRDNNTVYTGSQFGEYARVNKNTGENKSLQPSHKLGERPPRFNWQTPICLSKHNPDIFYMGSNRLHRSLDKGEHFEAISGDLTHGGTQGDIPYGTLTTIDESPLKFGLIYAGSDDGYIHVTRDGGNSWTRISNNLPQHLWVSRVEASHTDTGTVYVSLNGYRRDDFNAYAYRSDDYGNTWKKIGNDLPQEPINVVREDPANSNIIYAGTDNGVYLSFDKGNTFMEMSNGLPHVPVHDLAVHPRDKELVVGTHGRSIYIANVEHAEQLTSEILAQSLFSFPIPGVDFKKNWGKRSGWSEPDTPHVKIVFYQNRPGTSIIRVKSEDGGLMHELKNESDRGLNYVAYDLSTDSISLDRNVKALNKKSNDKKSEHAKPLKAKRADNGKFYLMPGTYTVEIESNGSRQTQKLEIKEKEKKPRGTSKSDNGEEE